MSVAAPRLQGTVAEARDDTTGARVAIKGFRGDADSNSAEYARFHRAASIRIGHPLVVDPIMHGEENGLCYLVMPFIAGQTADLYVHENGGTLDAIQATLLIRLIADGLRAIHAKGYVHRDLKPGNILVTPQGLPYIIDLGICRDLNGPTLSRPGGILGSYPWMSPEQANSSTDIDARCDLYALGGIYYSFLTGQPPARGSQANEILVSIQTYTPPAPHVVNSSIPRATSDACMRLLAKDRRQRFQTAAEFLATLDGNSPRVLCRQCRMLIVADAMFCTHCGTGCTRAVRCFACGHSVNGDAHCPHCQRAFGRVNHRLAFHRGALAGEVFRVPEGIYTVGRSQLANHDTRLSRKHLTVACANGTLSLRDAGSTNKTYIAGKRADQPIAIVAGQDMQIADNTATYQKGATP